MIFPNESWREVEVTSQIREQGPKIGEFGDGPRELAMPYIAGLALPQTFM